MPEYLGSCYLIDVKWFSEFCQWKWKSVVMIEAKKKKKASIIGSPTVEKQREGEEKEGWSTGCPPSFCMQAKIQECFSTS